MKVRFLYVFALILVFASCGGQQNNDKKETKKPKYIFLFIGDGMGPVQVQSSEKYLNLSGDSLCFLNYPVKTQTATHSGNSEITGSAASGTAIACGKKTYNGAIGVDIDTVALISVAERAKEKGMGVGIVSSVYLNHATPAVFYATSKYRKNMVEIGEQLPKSGFDYFGGGGIRDAKNDTLDIYKDAEEKYGYTIVKDKSSLDAISGDKVMFLSDIVDNHLTIHDVIDAPENSIHLKQYVSTGINLLEAKQKPFFMMVEGGKVDWMCHGNDFAGAVHEMIDFNDAILSAMDFYNRYPEETLIIVTADHETGGLGLGNNFMPYNLNVGVFQEQKISGARLTNILAEKEQSEFPKDSLYALLRKSFGFNGEKIKLNRLDSVRIEKSYNHYFNLNSGEDEMLYSKSNTISETALEIMTEKSGLGWTSRAHTAADVPLYAIGCGAGEFQNCYDNTQIARIIFSFID